VRRIPDDWLADFPTQPWAQNRASETAFATNAVASMTPFWWETVSTDAPALKAVMESMLKGRAGDSAG
jgi:hypothetical protein